MTEVELRLEREDREGIVAVGSYLIDALKRIGFRFEADCDAANDQHFCTVEITHGDERLSPLTRIEKEHFTHFPRLKNERLACQVKLEQPGEVTVMTKEKKEEPKAEESSNDYRKEFAELPLEKQIADLVRLEAIAFSETISFIVNSPFKVFEKAMDVMAEFGFKLEAEAKAASRPEEHLNGESGKAKTEPETEDVEGKAANGSSGE
jgi:ferredoxin